MAIALAVNCDSQSSAHIDRALVPFSKIPNHYPRAALLLSDQRIDEVRPRDFGVGYGNSSGYASGRRYTCEWVTPRFRMT